MIINDFCGYLLPLSGKKPEESNKKDQKKNEDKPKKEKKQKAAPVQAAAATDDKPIDVSRLSMKVGKIVECVKHPGNVCFVI